MALPNIEIGVGQPPLIWSEVQQALIKINDNFTALDLATGGSAVDLTSLGTSLIPRETETYDLGSLSKKWRDLYLSGNSIFLGDAVITSDGNSVNLPAGSTIDGSVLDNEYFREIAVSGQANIIADAGGTDVLTLNNGVGINITTNPTTDTLTFINTGVVSNIAGQGIGVSGAGTGNVTITNTGVRTISATNGVSVNSSSGDVVITNSGVVRLEAGNGIILDATTGVITVTNGSPASTLRTFRYISPFNYNENAPSAPISLPIMQAVGNDDTFSIRSTSKNIVLGSSGRTLTMAFDTDIDITGSVFADNSTLLVDGVMGRIVGPVFANVTGNVVGNVTGNLTGNSNGFHDGDVSGSIFADSSTMLVDGTNGVLTADINKATAITLTANSQEWVFNTSGVLKLPNVLNFTSSNPAWPSNVGWASGLGKFLIDSYTDVVIQTDNDGDGTLPQWTFGANGTTSFPNYTLPAADGAADYVFSTSGSGTVSWVNPDVKTTVSLTGGLNGILDTLTLTPTANVNWVAGTYNLTLTGGTTNASVRFIVDAGKNITYLILNGGSGFTPTQTITVLGTALGGLTPTHDLTVTVNAVSLTTTALNLTKAVQKLTSGNYSLANGTNGQIMHFVPQTGSDADNIKITLANAQRFDSTTGVSSVAATVVWYPYDKAAYSAAGLETPTLTTAIFTDGAWNVSSGNLI